VTCSLELLNTTRGLRTPKHGGCYLMDGGVADTACHTQAVVLLKLFNTTRKLSGPLSRTVVSPFRPPSSAQAQEQCTGAVVCYAPDDDAIDGAQSPEEFPPQTHLGSFIRTYGVIC